MQKQPHFTFVGNATALIFRMITIAAVLLLWVNTMPEAQAQATAYIPKDQVLYDTIIHMDDIMFDAFNHHDLDTLKRVFSENVEFYDDGGGVKDYQTTIANFKSMFERNAATGLRRELVKGSLEVYPLPNFGAVEMGTHRFIHTENGKEEVGTMKFVQVWQNKNGEWKATRVISVGH